MTTNVDDYFGQSKAGNSKSWKDHKIPKNGALVARIAPPIKSLKNSGRWCVYDCLHWGYYVQNEENANEKWPRPFKCIQVKNRATGMIEQDCPECQRMAKDLEKIELRKKEAVDKGMTEEQAKEFVRPALDHARKFSLDKKFYLLAKDLNGDWGTLRIGYKLKQQLDALIGEYMQMTGGKHPFDPKTGAWLRFKRMGENFNDTVYTVELEREILEDKMTSRIKIGELTQADVEALKEGPDLVSVNDSKALTYDQIVALTKSGNDPQTVAMIFGQPVRSRKREPEASVTAVSPASVQASPVMVPPASAVMPTATEDDEEAMLEAKLAQARAAKATRAAAASQQADAPKPAPTQNVVPENKNAGTATNFSDLLKLPPEEFLAKFGPK